MNVVYRMLTLPPSSSTISSAATATPAETAQTVTKAWRIFLLWDLLVFFSPCVVPYDYNIQIYWEETSHLHHKGIRGSFFSIKYPFGLWKTYCAWQVRRRKGLSTFPYIAFDILAYADSDGGVQEQAFNLVRNLTELKDRTAMVFKEVGKVLSCIGCVKFWERQHCSSGICISSTNFLFILYWRPILVP